MIGPDAFAVLVWGVFTVGWIGVIAIAVAVVREIILLITARRRGHDSTPRDAPAPDDR